MEKATEIVARTLDVVSAYDYAGKGFVHVRVEGYDDVKRLPRLIEFKGRTYEWSGWNSDTNEAYYHEYVGEPQRHIVVKKGGR